MRYVINSFTDRGSYYCSYYDTDEDALYFEVKLSPIIKVDLHSVNRICMNHKHYYDVEYIGKTVNDSHLFKVTNYYNRWFERNMK